MDHESCAGWDERRISSIEDKLDKFAAAQSRDHDLLVRIDTRMEKLDGIDDKMRLLMNKPAQRWDDLIKTIIGLVVGAVFALVWTSLLK
jgi:tetrahydromethanopterin S-methyltransferase subunit G